MLEMAREMESLSLNTYDIFKRTILKEKEVQPPFIKAKSIAMIIIAAIGFKVSQNTTKLDRPITVTIVAPIGFKVL